MRRRHLLIAAASSLTAACGGTLAPAAISPAASLPALAASPSRGYWPEVVRAAPAPVREAYAWAVENERVLRYIPCYCGCGLSAGHQDNFDCYVSEVKAAGWVVLDTHSLG